MKIAFLEPFYGGSHREFADGLIAHSRHEIDLFTLPARLWKWRYRNAAFELLPQITTGGYDLVLTSGLVRVADLRARWPGPCPPVLLYLHESQISYPKPDPAADTVEFAWAELSNAMAAHRIVFNSTFHQQEFLAAAGQWLARAPEGFGRQRRQGLLAEIEGRSRVCYPACRLPEGLQRCAADGGPAIIVWNHRWEFDKAPDQFLEVLTRLAGRGIEFRLALLGERVIAIPEALAAARARFPGRIVVDGYQASRRDYFQVLADSDVVVSTALQENFGYSVMEAIWAGCFPLLPNRLVYPELLPHDLFGACLYRDLEDLVERLASMLTAGVPREPRLREMAANHR